MLGDTAERLMDRYGGDLRRLRDEAGGDLSRLRGRLKEFKGIGDADIFLREVQGCWDEVCPFADRRVLDVARDLDMGYDASALRGLVDSDGEFVRLSAALVRLGLAKDTPPDILTEVLD